MALRISLCMILRDEEELLPEFLERARGAHDELVAVDTGSVDRTPALLAAAGARILHEPWRGDFAAARNVSLGAATGDLVLVLDADEMLPPGFAPELRAAAQASDLGAATVVMRNQLAHGHRHELSLLRAFRRDPAIRFHHAIHEDVTDSVLAHLAQTGRRLVHLASPVAHLGYQRERAAAKGKKARDVAILERCLAADPLDLYSHFKRLEQARFWGDRELWARAARDAAQAMDAAPARLAAAHHGGELAVLVADGLDRGAPATALARLDRLAPRVAPSAALHLRRGELRETVGDGRAGDDFRACLALAPVTANRQLTSVRPLLGLARLALARGDLATALARIDEALAAGPFDAEALLAAAALHRARGGREAVLRFAEQHARAHGASPELNAALGEAALVAGDLDLALPALAAAAGAPPSGRAALSLAQALVAAGHFPAARAACAAIARDIPEAGLGLLLCDLAEGRDSDLTLELEQGEADRGLRAFVAAVRAGGRADVLAALRAAAPAVSGPFPWLAGALG